MDNRLPVHADRLARRRGESSSGVLTSLTLAFLIAGLVILSAVALWSGPGGDSAEGGAGAVQEIAGP
jgi:hypothetical protein